MAAGLSRRWAWILAFVLTFLIGFSRLYLGMHFVHDVLLGWLIGLILLLVFLKLWEPVAAWLKQKTTGQQVSVAFVTSLLMIAVGIFFIVPVNAYVFPAEWTENALRAGPVPDPVSIEGSSPPPVYSLGWRLA